MGHVFLATLGQRPSAITMALDILREQHDYETVGILHTHPEKSDIRDALLELSDVLDEHFSGIPVKYHELRFGDGTNLLDVKDQHSAEGYYLALMDILYRYKKSGNRIHLLVAGGRKSMSIYGTLAASMIFNIEDSVMTILTPQDLMKPGIYTVPAKRYRDIKIVQLPLMPSHLSSPDAVPQGLLKDILALRRAPQKRFLENLTPQETALVDMLKLYPYESNAELAERLFKAKRTVDNQFAAIYQKMEALLNMELDDNRKRQALLDVVLGRY